LAGNHLYNVLSFRANANKDLEPICSHDLDVKWTGQFWRWFKTNI